MFLNAALAVSLFMGGGEVIPFWDQIGRWLPAAAPIVDLVNQGGVLWFFGKTLTLIVFIQWCRFTLPRLRIDQLMDLAWKVLLPAGFLNLILSAIYITFGFIPFAVGLGLSLLLVLFIALAYRNRRRATAEQLERRIRLAMERAREPAGLAQHRQLMAEIRAISAEFNQWRDTARAELDGIEAALHQLAGADEGTSATQKQLNTLAHEMGIKPPPTPLDEAGTEEEEVHEAALPARQRVTSRFHTSAPGGQC